MIEVLTNTTILNTTEWKCALTPSMKVKTSTIQDIDLRKLGEASSFGKKNKTPKENAACFLVNTLEFIKDPKSSKVLLFYKRNQKNSSSTWTE